MSEERCLTNDDAPKPFIVVPWLQFTSCPEWHAKIMGPMAINPANIDWIRAGTNEVARENLPADAYAAPLFSVVQMCGRETWLGLPPWDLLALIKEREKQ